MNAHLKKNGQGAKRVKRCWGAVDAESWLRRRRARRMCTSCDFPCSILGTLGTCGSKVNCFVERQRVGEMGTSFCLVKRTGESRNEGQRTGRFTNTGGNPWFQMAAVEGSLAGKLPQPPCLAKHAEYGPRATGDSVTRCSLNLRTKMSPTASRLPFPPLPPLPTFPPYSLHSARSPFLKSTYPRRIHH